MAKKPKPKKWPSTARQAAIAMPSRMMEPKRVDSLLDAMRDGNEYGSIVSVLPQPDLNIVDEIVKGIAAIEALRGRPCLTYVGNVVRRDDGDSGVDSTDDLPFWEMVRQVPAAVRSVDVFLATRGGSAHQISRFVNCLRSRFDEVDFLVPSFCMSAGTLFVLSGDRIWMTPRACLGPIDPQVPTKEGRYVPAQALLLLVDQLQKNGDEALKKGQPVPWTAVRIIDTLDKKELGDAITASHYSRMMAAQFLNSYKLKGWTVRETTKQPIDVAYKEARANEIAAQLVSHERWKSHGHAISREVLWTEIQLLIDHPQPDLERAMERLWALSHWLFEKSTALKYMVSTSYRYVRFTVQPQEKR